MYYFATILTPNGQAVGDPIKLEESLEASISSFLEQNLKKPWGVELQSRSFAWLSRSDAKAGRAIIAKE